MPAALAERAQTCCSTHSRVTTAIKRETKRRAAIEPVISHIKNEHRMDRNYLAHGKGDAINTVLAAEGHKLRLLLNWLRLL